MTEDHRVEVSEAELREAAKNENEIWFRRDDGHEICCNSGSMVEQIMSRDQARFVRIDGPGGEPTPDQGPGATIIDLTPYTREESMQWAMSFIATATRATDRPERTHCAMCEQELPKKG